MAELIDVPGTEGPVNEAERLVVTTLLAALPTGYWIAPNVEITEPGGQRYEYDAIVVAPHAVYVLETKAWHGEILGDDREWLVNGSTRRSPLATTERKAKVLKSKLVERTPALARVWVEAAVVLAVEPASLELTNDVARRVFRIGEVAAFLSDPGQVGQRSAAMAALSSHVVRALASRARRRSGPLVFGPYEVLDRLEQGDEEAAYRARHRLMPAAPPVRLRVITLSPYRLTEQQRAERRAALYRENEALLRMGSHPNVVSAREVFEDEGRIVVVLDDTQGRTLRQRLRDGTPLTVEQRLDILIDVARALAHAHSHGVVHRQVEPASILLGDDGVTRLANFGRAKLLVEGAHTVWQEDTVGLLDPRYTAPELADPRLDAPSPPTDLYALGCVAFELFAGHPPYDGPNQAFGQVPPLPQGTPDELAQLITSLVAGTQAQRPDNAKDVLTVLQGLRSADRERPVTGPKDEYAPGDLIDGKFEVRKRLGGGGFSTVYRVYRAMDDQEFALKVFNVDVSYDKIQREVTMLRAISHPRVVKVVWADRTRAGQWYMVSELIQGEDFTAYASGQKRLAPAEAVEVTCQLLSALEAIHPNTRRLAELQAVDELSDEQYAELMRLRSEGIVHRDIKPQNLMLTTDGLMLIDFNIASRVGQRVDTISGTPPYQSPDITPGVESWDVSPDLFATGVTLYELLCCEHPYEGSQPRVDRLPRDPREHRSDLSPELADFLLKACAPFRGERFETAAEMRDALERIEVLTVEPTTEREAMLPPTLRALLENHPPNVNPMVRELLSLSSQARRSNRRTRGMDLLAEATYVETKIDAGLGGSVLSGEHRLVIVTGNAGDGKTAFIQQIEQAALARGGEMISATPNGRRIRYAGHEIVTLYDGSQDEAERTSDEVLRDFLSPFADEPRHDDAVRLAAINEGRLRDFLLAHRSSFGRLGNEVLATLDDPDATPPTSGVIVNLNLRSVTVGGKDSIFSRQVRRIVDAPFWGPCESCDYRTRCPLKHNVDTLRDSTSGPAVTELLRKLVELVQLRRRRHLTMRDVRSMISHLLFRDRTCEEVPALLSSDDPFDVIDIAYFQGPGGLGAPPSSTLERGAALLSEVDVALVPNPEDDRAMARGAGPRRMAFSERTSEYPSELIAEARRRGGTGYAADPVLARRAHEAARRQLYFERADDAWWEMLPYQRLREFDQALASEGNARQRLKNEVIEALSLYEGLPDIDQASGALWLATNEEGATGFRSFRRYPLDEFVLVASERQSAYLETGADHLRLIHQPSGASLSIDIDLMEVLERLREGQVPTLDEGRGFLVNLRLFKQRLLAVPASELLMVADGEVMQIRAGATKGSVLLRPLSAATR